MTDKPLVEKMVEASWWPFRAADGVKRRAEMGAALAVAKPEIEKALLEAQYKWALEQSWESKGTPGGLATLEVFADEKFGIDLGGSDD